jgi:hypothetical protein
MRKERCRQERGSEAGNGSEQVHERRPQSRFQACDTCSTGMPLKSAV